MMCPGPLLKLREAMDALSAGDCLEIKASDPGFARDVQAFCNTSGHTLLDLDKSHGVLTARVQKGVGISATGPVAGNNAPAAPRSGATLVSFSGELDKAMAAFIIATGAAAMGGTATIFFTFWGLDELVNGVETGGVADMLACSAASATSMFI